MDCSKPQIKCLMAHSCSYDFLIPLPHTLITIFNEASILTVGFRRRRKCRQLYVCIWPNFSSPFEPSVEACTSISYQAGPRKGSLLLMNQESKILNSSHVYMMRKRIIFLRIEPFCKKAPKLAPYFKWKFTINRMICCKMTMRDGIC